MLLVLAPMAERLSAQGPGAPPSFVIDLKRYFPTPEAELRARATVLADVSAFIASDTPSTPGGLASWLERYDDLLVRLERHDVYVYVRAEENDADAADAAADETFGAREDGLEERIARAAQELGSERVQSLVHAPELTSRRYLLLNALERAEHRAPESSAPAALAGAAARYRLLRKLPGSVASHEADYAALLLDIVSARQETAHQRGFPDAEAAAYFDRGLAEDGVARALAAVQGSRSWEHYRAIAERVRAPTASLPPQSITATIAKIEAATRRLGPAYAAAYSALLNPANHRLEICTAAHCDRTGFSVGFAGVSSGVFYGGFDGSVNAMRALAHESGHAVNRELMSAHQPIAAYNRGPHFMMESFAIFNELLFLDNLYRTASSDALRLTYLKAFLDDATFQVAGSAQETALESAIARGAKAGTLETAADLDALTKQVTARYDPAAARRPDAALAWASNRLFFTDPFYDVNYLYAGLLAIKYFEEWEGDPAGFVPRYLRLLEDGFDDTPAALLERSLGIDLHDEPGLVRSAGALIDARASALQALIAKQSIPR